MPSRLLHRLPDFFPLASSILGAMVLRAEGLVKRFGEVSAVSEFCLSVHAGEVVGLLGPNGAGKTTTLRMLAGILRPTEGHVWIAGLDVHREPLLAKPKIGFLSGDTQLYQRLSPREILRYFGRLYGLEEEPLSHRIETMISELAMTDFADRPCATLSAGQKQRANIARAFLHQPDLLILDEPTTALDVVSGRFIVEAIRAQRQQGKAILFSTHIMSEADYLCDRVVLMHEGRSIEEGTVSALLARTRTINLTDAFLACVQAVPPPALDADRGKATLFTTIANSYNRRLQSNHFRTECMSSSATRPVHPV